MVDMALPVRQTVDQFPDTSSPYGGGVTLIRRMLMLSGLFVVLFATAAHAQYVPGEPGIIVDPGTVEVGGSIEVQGTGCPRDATVTIYVGDVLVATTTASDDGTGSFDVKDIVLPDSIGPGNYTVHAFCGELDLTAVLSVTAVATTTPPSTVLPVTGSDSGIYIKAGLGLVAVGGLLVLGTRRRRATV
jgi:LPXTG-motif cell wall-anchored protein